MVIDGYQWLYVVINGYTLYMVISGYTWLSVVIHGLGLGQLCQHKYEHNRS